MAETSQPIIIKKITKISGGHHGGAWKVAYADFVTAMFAFFLLLWLLSTSSEATKNGIAEYFTPTYGIKDSQGIGFEGGLTQSDVGVSKSDLAPPGIVTGQTPPGVTPGSPDQQAQIESDQDAQLFEKAEESIKKAFEADPNLNEMRDNIIVEQSPEGLKIEVADSDKFSMFEPGSEDISQYGRKILEKIATVVKRMPNYISITGHTDIEAFGGGNAKYGNWELSAGRANAARRFLMTTGIEDLRIGKVVGRASRELLLPESPKSPRNRRITVILLRGTHMVIPDELRSAPRSLISVPKVNRVDKKPVQEKMEKPAAVTAPAASNAGKVWDNGAAGHEEAAPMGFSATPPAEPAPKAEPVTPAASPVPSDAQAH